MSRFFEDVTRRRCRHGLGWSRGVLAWGTAAAALALLCVGALGAAGSVEASSTEGASAGRAPEWPFRGVVNHGGDVLEYWDAETGTLSGVRLGGPQGCPSPVVGNEDYVELAWWSLGGGRDVILRVPWGDEAYPYFAKSQDVPRRYLRQARELGVEVSVVAAGFRVTTAGGEAYYDRADEGGLRLLRTGGSLEEHLEASGVESDEDFEFGWHYVVGLDGTDGFHYGFRLVHPEPNCQREEGFIVAGDTGEVVACGLGRGGAWLVLPEGAPRVVERFALPRWGDCDRSEDWHLGLGGVSLASDSGG